MCLSSLDAAEKKREMYSSLSNEALLCVAGWGCGHEALVRRLFLRLFATLLKVRVRVSPGSTQLLLSKQWCTTGREGYRELHEAAGS